MEHVARRRGMSNMWARYNMCDIYMQYFCAMCVYIIYVQYLYLIYVQYLCAIYTCDVRYRYIIIYVYNIYVRYTCVIYMCIVYVQHSFMYAMLGGGMGWRIYCYLLM